MIYASLFLPRKEEPLLSDKQNGILPGKDLLISQFAGITLPYHYSQEQIYSVEASNIQKPGFFLNMPNVLKVCEVRGVWKEVNFFHIHLEGPCFGSLFVTPAVTFFQLTNFLEPLILLAKYTISRVQPCNVCKEQKNSVPRIDVLQK